MAQIQQHFDQLSQAIKDHGEINSYGIGYENDTLTVTVFSNVNHDVSMALDQLHPDLRFIFKGRIKEIPQKRPRIRKSIWRQAVNI